MSEKLYPEGVSSCCGKPLIIVSDSTTCYYKCQKCGDACDDRNFGDERKP